MHDFVNENQPGIGVSRNPSPIEVPVEVPCYFVIFKTICQCPSKKTKKSGQPVEKWMKDQPYRPPAQGPISQTDLSLAIYHFILDFSPKTNLTLSVKSAPGLV